MFSNVVARFKGATASSKAALCFCRRMGPMASRGTRSRALLRKATKRNIKAGDLLSNVERDFLSLAIELVDDPKLIMRSTTFPADTDPLEVRSPGHSLNIFRASYRLSLRVSPRSPTKARSSACSTEKDFGSSPESSQRSCKSRSSGVLLALIMATLGVCEKMAATSFPVSPNSVITAMTASTSKFFAASGERTGVIPFRPETDSYSPAVHIASLSWRNFRIRRLVIRART